MRNIIVLDSEYHITNDTENWILNYSKEGEVNKKTGKPKVSKDNWFFPKLSTALNKYVDLSLKDCDGIKQVNQKLDELSVRFEKILTKR